MDKVCYLLVAVLSMAQAAFVPIAPEIHKPMPYTFGYTVKDKHGEQHREETGDGVGIVKGSYGFTDERGIHRQVHYVADKAGFRAEVKTNEHGTAPMDPAAVKMISSAHPYLGGAGLGYKPIAAGLGPLVAESAAFGVPVAAPGLFKKGFSAGLGPLVAESAEFGVPVAAPGLLKEGFGAGYGGPLKAGFIKGYDSRFGAY